MCTIHAAPGRKPAPDGEHWRWRYRFGGALGVLAATSLTGLAAPGVSAGAAPASVGLAFGSAVGRAGTPGVLSATVAFDGSPAPDGTAVQFHPDGGLIADRLYTAIAAAAQGYWIAGADGTVRSFGGAAAVQGMQTDSLQDPVAAHRCRHVR